MKKLLQINICVNLKSTGRIVEQLCVLARQAGFETYAAGVEIQEPSSANLYYVKNDCSRFLHRLETRFLAAQGLGSKIPTRRLIQWVEEVQPDIIHLHNLHCSYLNFPLFFRFLQSYGKPVIWTCHDCWPMTGHCTHFEAISCDKWKTACSNCPEIPPLCLDRSAQNFALKKKVFTSLPNLTWVAVSDWMSNLLSSSFLASQKRQVIKNGVDISVFKPYDKKQSRKELGLAEDAFVVLAASTVWNDEKGLKEIIRFSENPDFQLVMLGVSPGLLQVLPQSILAIPLVLDTEILAKYYSAADVFVNPTYNDSFSLVNVEAQACGTPVVCYRSGGAPDTISPQTGIVVPRGDFEALQQAVYLIKKKEFATTKELCQDWVRANFDKEKNYQQYIDLYQQLLYERK